MGSKDPSGSQEPTPSSHEDEFLPVSGALSLSLQTFRLHFPVSLAGSRGRDLNFGQWTMGLPKDRPLSPLDATETLGPLTMAEPQQ